MASAQSNSASVATALPSAKVKAPKAKKAMAASNKPKASSPSHPPYVEMIREAIGSLKERTGSSHYAITKFIEEKQSHLPSNFKKLLFVQLKKLVVGGMLVKVKNSFKLSSVASKPKAATAATAAEKAAPAMKALVKKKAEANTFVQPKAKSAAVKAKAGSKWKAKPKERPAKAAKRSVKSWPEKLAAAMVKGKKSPLRVVAKKVRSIKSPAKKGKKKM